MTEKKISIEQPESYKNVGKEAFKRASKTNKETVTVRELSDAMSSNIMPKVMDTAQKYKSSFDGLFYVVVLFKREKLIQKTLKIYYIAKQSCPSPSYEQAVFSFDPKTDELKFLWMIPQKSWVKFMYKNRHLLEVQGDPALPDIVDFVESRLCNRAVIMNKESESHLLKHPMII